MAKMTTAARSGQRGCTFFLVSILPMLAALLFLVGSALFWPKTGEALHTDGAAFFLIGSVISCVVPSLDLSALCRLTRLLDVERAKPSENEFSFDLWRPAYWPGPDTADYEYLYLSQMIQIQIITAAFYLVADISFVAGSTLWFPQLDSDYLTQGAWLFIFGSGLNIAGASMAYVTSRELQKISVAKTVGSKGLAQLSCWTDEQAAMSSSITYLSGNILFVIGTALLFPVVTTEGDAFAYIGTAAFIVGSALFLLASVIDIVVMWRRAPWATSHVTVEESVEPVEGEALLQGENHR